MKIYCYIPGQPWPGDYAVVALAEDGVLLAQHVSSSPSWARNDIGVGSENGIAASKHQSYREHCPDGYELVWVDDSKTHAGVQAALVLNRAAEAAATANEETTGA